MEYKQHCIPSFQINLQMSRLHALILLLADVIIVVCNNDVHEPVSQEYQFSKSHPLAAVETGHVNCELLRTLCNSCAYPSSGTWCGQWGG